MPDPSRSRKPPQLRMPEAPRLTERDRVEFAQAVAETPPELLGAVRDLPSASGLPSPSAVLRELRAASGGCATTPRSRCAQKTQEEARQLLESFLRARRLTGDRFVMVIHGKGYRSPEGRAVLAPRVPNGSPAGSPNWSPPGARRAARTAGARALRGARASGARATSPPPRLAGRGVFSADGADGADEPDARVPALPTQGHRLGPGAIPEVRRPPVSPGARASAPGAGHRCVARLRPRMRRRGRHPDHRGAVFHRPRDRLDSFPGDAGEGFRRTGPQRVGPGRHRGLETRAGAGPHLFQRRPALARGSPGRCSPGSSGFSPRAVASRCRCRSVTPSRPTC